VNASREVLRPPSQPSKDQLVLQVENVPLAGRLLTIQIFEVAPTKATGTPSSALRSTPTPPTSSGSARSSGLRVAARDDVENEYSLFVTRQKAEFLFRAAYPVEAAASTTINPEAMANGILAHLNIIGNRQRDVGKLVCREPEPRVEKRTRVLPAATPPHKQKNPHLPSKRQDQRAVRVQKTSKRTMEAVAQAMRRPDPDWSGDEESAGSEVESSPKVDRKSSEASILHRMAVADAKTMWKAELETNYEDSERPSFSLEDEEPDTRQALEISLAPGLSPVRRALPERKTKHRDLEERRQKGRQQRILVAQAAQEASSAVSMDGHEVYSTVIEEAEDADSEFGRRASMATAGNSEQPPPQPRASSAPRSSVVVGNAYGLKNLPESDASEPEQFLRRRTLDTHRSVLRKDHWQESIPGMGIEITDERPVYQTPPNRLDALMSTARRVMLVNALGTQRSASTTNLSSEEEHQSVRKPSIYSTALHASHSAPALSSPKAEKLTSVDPVETEPAAPQIAAEEALVSSDNNAGERLPPASATEPDAKQSPRPRSKSTSTDFVAVPPTVVMRSSSVDAAFSDTLSTATREARSPFIESSALRPRSNSMGSEGIVRSAPLSGAGTPEAPAAEFLVSDNSEPSVDVGLPPEELAVQEKEETPPPSDPEIVLYPASSEFVDEWRESGREVDAPGENDEDALSSVVAGLGLQAADQAVTEACIDADTTNNDQLNELNASEGFPAVDRRDFDSPRTTPQACWEEQTATTMEHSGEQAADLSIIAVDPVEMPCEAESEGGHTLDEVAHGNETSEPPLGESDEPTQLRDSGLGSASETAQDTGGDGDTWQQSSPVSDSAEPEEYLLQNVFVQQAGAQQTSGDLNPNTKVDFGDTDLESVGFEPSQANESDGSTLVDTGMEERHGDNEDGENIRPESESRSLDAVVTSTDGTCGGADVKSDGVEAVESSTDVFENDSKAAEETSLGDVISGTPSVEGEAESGCSQANDRELGINETKANGLDGSASSAGVCQEEALPSEEREINARSFNDDVLVLSEQDPAAHFSHHNSVSAEEQEDGDVVYSVEATNDTSCEHDSYQERPLPAAAEINEGVEPLTNINSASDDKTPRTDSATVPPSAQLEHTQVQADRGDPSGLLRKKSPIPSKKLAGPTGSTGHTKASSKATGSRRRSTVAQVVNPPDVVPPTPKLERRHTAEDVKRRGLRKGSRRMSIADQSALPGLASSISPKPAAKASIEKGPVEASRSNSKRQTPSNRQSVHLPGSPQSVSSYHKKWSKWMVGRNIIEKVGSLQLEELVIADPNNEENLLRLGMRYTRWSGTSLPGILLLEHAALLHKSTSRSSDYWFWLGSAHLDIFLRHRKYLPIARFHLSKSIWAFTSAFAYIESLADPMRLLRYAIGLFWHKGDGSLEKTRDIFHELFSRFVSFCDKDLPNLLFLQFQVFHRLKLYMDAIECMNKILALHERLPQQAVSRASGLTSTNALAHFSVYDAADYKLMLMQCQQASGDYVSAAQSLAAVLKLKSVQQDTTLRDEEYFDVWCSLAEKCFHHEDYTLALEYYAIALNFAKQSHVLAAIHYNLGLCFQSLGEDNKCVTEYKRARTANRHVSPLVSLAELSLPYDERFALLLQKSVAQTVEEVRVELYGRAVKRLQRVFRQSRRNLNLDSASNGNGSDSPSTKMPSLSKRRLSIAAARNPPTLVKIEDTTEEAEASEEDHSQPKAGGVAAESQASRQEDSTLEVVERRHESFIARKQAAMEEMAELLTNPQYRGREASPSSRPADARLKTGTQLRSGILSPAKDRLDVRRKHSMEAFRQVLDRLVCCSAKWFTPHIVCSPVLTARLRVLHNALDRVLGEAARSSAGAFRVTPSLVRKHCPDSGKTAVGDGRGRLLRSRGKCRKCS
jgi:tetratricopeptide (TPR) repeat protein